MIKLIQERYGQPYPPQQVLKMFYQTCRAVAHMHKQTPPVIHRDLKVGRHNSKNNKLPNSASTGWTRGGDLIEVLQYGITMPKWIMY